MSVKPSTTTNGGSGKRGGMIPAPLWLAGVFLLAACTGALAKGSVLNSPHNLSASGPATGLHSTQEGRVCIFCHAPHNAQAGTALWNRDLPSSAGYTPYNSTTMQAVVSQVPTGASRLCLSCHDGTIALSSFKGSSVTDLFALGAGTPSYLGKNLSANHPVSFLYDASLVSRTQNTLVPPQALPPVVKLDQYGDMECTACHDPHDDEFGKFLVMSNAAAGSPLCISCHNYAGWTPSGTPHYTATRPRSASDPSTVTGCMNCHDSHNAAKAQRLLHYANEEDNCLKSCHNTLPKDLSTLFTRVYRHPVDASNTAHDENETLPAAVFHVECADCHNPHLANGTGSPLASPPNINGALQGVRKNLLGSVATTEYDICFKCHSGANAWRFSGVSNSKVKRSITEPDLQRCFDNSNPSMHPVTNLRSTMRGAASLYTGVLTLLSSTSQIYCCDCHGNDQSTKAGGTGPNGPHGSSFEHILVARYDLPLTQQGYADVSYDLCYRCHSKDYIMGSGSGFTLSGGVNEHQKHVQLRGVPCFACHDPHGVPFNPSDPTAPKGTLANNAHLINFDLDWAGSNPLYQTTTPALGGSGTCMVACHVGNACNTHSYPVDTGCAAKPITLRSFPKQLRAPLH